MLRVHHLFCAAALVLTGFVFAQPSARAAASPRPSASPTQKLDPILQAELLAILDDDQKYRRQLDDTEKRFGRDSKEIRALWDMINAHDATDLAKVKAIIDSRGWVGPDIVGAQASSALFLVIQHADLPIQQRYLPLMRQAVRHGKADAAMLALLEDRVAIREGHRQIYGSQLARDERTGEFYVSPLEDPDHVDERRAQVGLPPLAAYLKHWNLTWDPGVYKKKLPTLEAAARTP